MRVLITGAAGFIGSNLVHYCVNNRPEWKVTALDLLTYAGNIENISSLIDSSTINFAKLDITDQGAITRLFEDQKFDLVLHLAAESHVDRSIHSSEAFIKTNVLGTQVLLDAALYSGVKTFVQVSTDEVYGSLGATGRFVETTPLDPTSPYAASKAASDLVALSYFKTHGFNLMVTRCTNNYGPYQFPEKLIPLFISNAMEDKRLPLYGDGMNVRSWLYVEDHCEALVLVAEKGRAGEVYNIGGMEEAEIPNVEVTKAILTGLGKSDTLIERVADRPAHDRRYAIDYTKIHNELGWKPRVEFPDGIEKTINWYVENRQWWERIKAGEYTKFYELNYSERASV